MIGINLGQGFAVVIFPQLHSLRSLPKLVELFCALLTPNDISLGLL